MGGETLPTFTLRHTGNHFPASRRHLTTMLATLARRGLRAAPATSRAASTITLDAKGALKVPNDPILPFIEGDGTGPGA